MKTLNHCSEEFSEIGVIDQELFSLRLSASAVRLYKGSSNHFKSRIADASFVSSASL
jgi:hypothetical protein